MLRASTQPVDPFLNNKLADKYQISSLIGEGGMSNVYEAIQDGVDRRVAIKVLKFELLDNEGYLKRFQREAKAISELSHPNLISVFDLGTAPTGQPYMVLEFLDGVTLSQILDSTGPLKFDRALPIFMQVCDVMEYAHRQGIIHRDLKPSNIMVVSHAACVDLVKVVDFGILKYDSSMHSISQKITQTGDICGSPIYMSPEQILDEKVDARTDIYSLGVVMYETLTGNYLFSGSKITDILDKHVNAIPTPLSKSVPQLQLPTMLEVAIFKTLEKNPKDRFQSMAELKEVLSTVQRRIGSKTAPALESSNLPDGRGPTVALETLAKPSTEIRKVSSSSPQQNHSAEAASVSQEAAPTSGRPFVSGHSVASGRSRTLPMPPGLVVDNSIPTPVIILGALLLGVLIAIGSYFMFFNKPGALKAPAVAPVVSDPVLDASTSAKSAATLLSPVISKEVVTPAQKKLNPLSQAKPDPVHKQARTNANSLLDEMNATENAFVNRNRHKDYDQ